MDATEYLMQINEIDEAIELLRYDIEYWKSVAEGSGTGSEGERVQSSSNQKKMEAAVVKYIQLEAEVKTLEKKKDEILATIKQLQFQEYQMIHKIYIQGKMIKEIVYEKKKSYSWGTMMHKRALTNLQKILDERGRKNGY